MKYDIKRIERTMMEKSLSVLAFSKKSKIPESTLRGMFATEGAHPHTVRKAAKALGLDLKDIIIDEEVSV
jgi:hypothetical protein